MAPRKAERKVRKMKSYEIKSLAFEVMADICRGIDESIDDLDQYHEDTQSDEFREYYEIKMKLLAQASKAIQRGCRLPWFDDDFLNQVDCPF